MNLSLTSTLSISIGISIFISMVIAWIILMSPRLQSLFQTRNIWIVLSIVQILYLMFEIVELSTGNDVFGIVSAAMVITLGLIIVALSLYEKEYQGLIEGLVYLVAGVIVLVLKVRERESVEE